MVSHPPNLKSKNLFLHHSPSNRILKKGASPHSIKRKIAQKHRIPASTISSKTEDPVFDFVKKLEKQKQPEIVYTERTTTPLYEKFATPSLQLDFTSTPKKEKSKNLKRVDSIGHAFKTPSYLRFKQQRYTQTSVLMDEVPS